MSREKLQFLAGVSILEVFPDADCLTGVIAGSRGYQQPYLQVRERGGIL